jgi:hypothetical protein
LAQSYGRGIYALLENKTLHLVPPNSTKTLTDCKWVYPIKKHGDGTIDCYKARLVAKCFKQRYGIHYKDTLVQLSMQLLSGLFW